MNPEDLAGQLEEITMTLALLGAQQAALAAWLAAVHAAHPARDAIPALFDEIAELARARALHAPLADKFSTQAVEHAFRTIREQMPRSG